MPDRHVPLLRLILAGGSLAARRALLERHGTAAAALVAGERAWRSCGLASEAIQRLHAPCPDAREAVRWLDGPRRHLIGWDDPRYPALLRHSRSPPLALFVEGNPEALSQPMVAIVGSRSPTPGGCDNAARFARELSLAGIGVASGMAAGIDASAHRAALDVADAATVAVVGTGPDIAYPRQHASLRDRIAAGPGAVLSEHLPGTSARASHFPSRNRILAGLSLITLVIEAAERSGALITARQAAEAGRDVFAVPGSIHNPLARGCHRLIRDGAGLATEPADLLDSLLAPISVFARSPIGYLHGAEPPASEAVKTEPLRQDPDYHGLWMALGHDPTGMDQLVERTGLTAANLSSMLLLMELDGRVAVEHGRYWRKS